MANSTSVVADRIIDICNELKVLLAKGGTFDSYTRKLLGKLQRLSIEIGESDFRADDMRDAFAKAYGEWRTTEDGNHVHFGKNGEPDKGNPYVIAAIKGELDKPRKPDNSLKRKGNMSCESKATFKNPDVVDFDRKGRKITHYNHDEDKMTVGKPIRLMDDYRSWYSLCKGDIEHLTVFASDEIGRGLDVANVLTNDLGGNPKLWKHVKGIGTVRGADGVERKADIHWFENPEVGQFGWKIKKFLDKMSDEEKYWVEG